MSLTSKISDAITGNHSRAFLSDGWDDIIFNSTKNFTENDSAETTDHVIEFGAEITDHVNAKPKSISFSGIVTDDNMELLDPTSFVEQKIPERFDILDMWLEEKTLLTYHHYKKDYENLQITNCTRNKNLDTANGWGVDITLKVISIVQAMVSELPGGVGEPKAKGATAKGKTKKAGKVTPAKEKTMLKGLTGS